MDDILASIRRILDEEGTRAAAPGEMPEPPAQPAAHPGAPAAPVSHEPVLELDSSMMLPEPDEAADIARVRSTIADHHALDTPYRTATTVRDRFAELIAAKPR